ncbi:MAG TPA: hypothetical protein VM680_04575 [Verrucomicrobiae bacterium]|nr:hypothetical protein [Verrucomicrobiae bacterium]
MKTMFEKLQGIGQKAVQIKHAIEGAPAKVATLREAMHQTAGQLQLTASQLQLARSELQQVATGLHVENDEDFTEAFREIAENHNAFHEAGYDLTGIDLEVSHGQRMIVHLRRLAAVPEQTLRFILSQHTARVTITSILSSIIKAESLAAKVTTPGLEYDGLIVHLGAAPAVRISWRDVQHAPAQIHTQPATPAHTHAPATIVAAAPIPLPRTTPAPPATSTFAQSNFFERHEPTAAAPTTDPLEIASALPTSRHAFNTSKSLQGDWKKEALERLKTSPGQSKYRR